MLVNIGNSVLSIYWKHHHINPKTGKEYKKWWTTCVIKLGIGPESEIIAESVAQCHKNDVFKKCEGRKLSLTRALQYIDEDPVCPIALNKDDRRLIWEKYVETTKCSFKVGGKEKVRKVKEEKIEVSNE